MAHALSILNRRIVRCRRCPRLVEHRESTALHKRRAYCDEAYWGRPVPGFGQRFARVVIVGLAPGAHGANRTGRVFTGDASGDFLFAALHRAGLSSQPRSLAADDGLRLIDCYITAAVRCAPPGNRPTAQERRTCNGFLAEELDLLRSARVYLCLGAIAFEEFQRATATRLGRFGHGESFRIRRRHVLSSYHVSRQNTQTGRLTVRMFDAVLREVNRRAGRAPGG